MDPHVRASLATPDFLGDQWPVSPPSSASKSAAQDSPAANYDRDIRPLKNPPLVCERWRRLDTVPVVIPNYAPPDSAYPETNPQPQEMPISSV